MDFFTGSGLIRIYNTLFMDLFLTNMELFKFSLDVNWWTGVTLWIIVFLTAVWTHSDGTHSLQRIHWWASDVMLDFSKTVLMKKQTHRRLRWPQCKYIFSKVWFWVNYFFNFAVLFIYFWLKLIAHSGFKSTSFHMTSMSADDFKYLSEWLYLFWSHSVKVSSRSSGQSSHR